MVYLAHDLKTPLTSVIGYLTLLRDEPQLSPELRARYTHIALEKAERLEDLINEFSSTSPASISPTWSWRSSPRTWRGCSSRWSANSSPCWRRRTSPAAWTCLRSCCAPATGRSSPGLFDNLLRNASYYSLPGTEVRIAGGSDGETITLTFTNAGKTIPQEKLDRSSSSSSGLDSSRATRTGGAGLGLAIAKEIVELHGGTIRAESAHDTVTFTVCLPAS